MKPFHQTNILIALILLVGCKSSLDLNTEKFQNNRNQIIDVNNNIVSISIDQYFKGVDLKIFNSYLFLIDVHGSDYVIFIYDKNSFEFIASAGIQGNGPGEIARATDVGYDYEREILWVNDHGQMAMWAFPLDSIFKNEIFKPTTKKSISSEMFVLDFYFINDSTALGKGIIPLSHNSFEMATVRFNVKANKIELFGYAHPNAKGRHLSNSYLNVSLKNNMYVSCHNSIDLITICDLEGNLKYNIYGEGWHKNPKTQFTFYCGVDFYKGYIISSYLGEKSVIYDEHSRPQSNLPTKLLVFDSKGNYKQTLETGYKIIDFCIDEDNNRIIAYFDDRENPLGHFNLDSILD